MNRLLNARISVDPDHCTVPRQRCVERSESAHIGRCELSEMLLEKLGVTHRRAGETHDADAARETSCRLEPAVDEHERVPVLAVTETTHHLGLDPRSFASRTE